MVAGRIRQRVNQQPDEGRGQAQSLHTPGQAEESATDQRNTAADTRERREAIAATLTAAATSFGAAADAVEEAVAAHILVEQCVGVDGSPTPRVKRPSRLRSQARRNLQQQERRRQLHR
jgi:hypothetical protein